MQSVIFSYLIPLPLLVVLAILVVILVVYARYLGLLGWPFRLVAAVFVLLALANPSLRSEERQRLNDIVLIIVDETSSHQLSGRTTQTEIALERLQDRVANEDRDIEIRRVQDGDKNSGTLIFSAIMQALSDIPAIRLSGIFIISDGQIHEDFAGLSLDVPVHHIVIGQKNTYDRKLSVLNAPAFGIIGENVPMVLRVDDLGGDQTEKNQKTRVYARVGSGRITEFNVPIGQDTELRVNVGNAGQNITEFWFDPIEGELTDQNNHSVVVVNGVRDRLRVLLVSGAPHPGGRVWRNLLKSDSSVDLVHFTILRPPSKQDGVPVSELSLIAFPTRELFMEKIVEQAKASKYVETLYGRKIHVPNIDSPNYMMRQASERVAINGPLQGSAADIIKVAMIEISKLLKKENLKIDLIMQVHDELVFEVPGEFNDSSILEIIQLMEESTKISVPLRVDYGFGANWKEAH